MTVMNRLGPIHMPLFGFDCDNTVYVCKTILTVCRWKTQTDAERRFEETWEENTLAWTLTIEDEEENDYDNMKKETMRRTMKRQRKSIEDIKMRYINTSNLEKIGDLLDNWIKTEERCGKEKDLWTSVETLSVM